MVKKINFTGKNGKNGKNEYAVNQPKLVYDNIISDHMKL
jgi:hypothetical protein